MFSSLRIRGFRCIPEVRLDRLGRINLIAGENNVGKTSVLEGLYLLLGHNDAFKPTLLNQWRGWERVRKTNDTVTPGELWGWLFHNKDVKSSILIDTEEDKTAFQLSIRLESRGAVAFTRENGGAKIDEAVLTPADFESQYQLALDYNENGKRVARATTWFEDDHLKLEPAELKQRPAVILPSSFLNRKADFDTFSVVMEKNREGELVDAMRVFEPRLKRIDLLTTGSSPYLATDIGDGRRIPLTLAGTGMQRFLSIMLASMELRDGVLLIDEIENGMHHSTLNAVWEAIHAHAARHNNQVFATTHSHDCVNAAWSAFDSMAEGEFRYHRIERNGNALRAVTLNHGELASMIMSNYEVR